MSITGNVSKHVWLLFCRSVENNCIENDIAIPINYVLLAHSIMVFSNVFPIFNWILTIMFLLKYAKLYVFHDLC